MPTLITGVDQFQILLEKQALEKSFLESQPDGEFATFDFEENSRGEYIRSVSEEAEGGLFSSPKLIILRQVSNLSENVQETLFDLVVSRSDVSWVIIEQGNLKKTDLYTKKLMSLSGIKIISCNTPSPETLQKLFRHLNEEAGVSFEPQAERIFFERIGNDTAKLYQEQIKIALYKQQGVVTKEETEMLLEPSLEDTGFQALDALARGERERATILFRQLFLWKKDALPILGLCAWQIRQMILLREAFDVGVRQSRELAQSTGISPYVTSKLLSVLPAFSLSRLRKAHELIWQYDHDLKKGLIDQGVAIDLLVWKI